MKTKSISNIQSFSLNKRSFSLKEDILCVFVVTAGILMVPLVAMQFTSEVKWNFFDFVVIGTLLVGTGLLLVLASRKIKKANHRVAVIFGLLVALLLIWAELAVGIFGTPFAGS